MTSNLLKFARARDDADFPWRIAAAMMVYAQQIEQWEISAASKMLVQWVFDNPMVAPSQMVNHVSTNVAIAANVNIDMGRVDTSAVPDDDIQYVVQEKWDRVAETLFTPVVETPVV